MTTQTPAPAANEKLLSTPKKIALFAVIILVTSAWGITTISAMTPSDEERQSRVVSMQESLTFHGFTTDETLPDRMVTSCHGAAPATDTKRKPTTATIIEEHDGATSVITLVCDGNSRISDFAVTPGS